MHDGAVGSSEDRDNREDPGFNIDQMLDLWRVCSNFTEPQNRDRKLLCEIIRVQCVVSAETQLGPHFHGNGVRFGLETS